MKNEKDKTELIEKHVRISAAMNYKLKELADEEGLTINSLIIDIIQKYLVKDIVPEELVLAKCGIIHHDLEKVKKIADMNGRLFMSFLNYYFLSNPVSGFKNKETLDLKWKEAVKDTEDFLSFFRKKLKNGSPAFLEQVIADVLEREVTSES